MAMIMTTTMTKSQNTQTKAEIKNLDPLDPFLTRFLQTRDTLIIREDQKIKDNNSKKDKKKRSQAKRQDNKTQGPKRAELGVKSPSGQTGRMCHKKILPLSDHGQPTTSQGLGLGRS
jgi:hypothetical protein